MYSETTTARGIFGALWGIVELGAVIAAEGDLSAVLLAPFVATRRAELDRLLADVQQIGDFEPETMAIFEAPGWERGDVQETIAYLMLYSEVGGASLNVDDPAVVARMVSVGADRQLTALLNALVSAAAAQRGGRDRRVGLITEAMRSAGQVLGRTDERLLEEVFRGWAGDHLASALSSTSPVPEATKACLRDYAQAIEEAVTSTVGGAYTAAALYPTTWGAVCELPDGRWETTWDLTLATPLREAAGADDIDVHQDETIGFRAVLKPDAKRGQARLRVVTDEPAMSAVYFPATFTAFGILNDQVAQIETIQGLPRGWYAPFRTRQS
ncbi:hypothetical protein [Streptomyces millisiae]|uniref:Uncharacterized protein n=1 Tax=Streptomyces millisiae TaxID=3075542 RepID=A0ABU2LVX9_9ACTN|nr:hypothetical protein [Streptomyces sp. DSM 44918]MDT0321423.1 hypothetical protein [Streptomyces sp. DSM 44918]